MNFFGPLQSGPGFRALYLKQKIGVRIRDFSTILIVNYLFFGFINTAVIGVYIAMQLNLVWGVVAAVLSIIALLVILQKWLFKNRFGALTSHLLSQDACIIFLVTLLQCSLVTGIYFVELLSVNNSVSFVQTLLFAAVANLTLFVALTPGAIGIRESFLLFSQQLHGIDQQTVIAASIIDRALYFVVLGLLFALSLSFHAKQKLSLRKSTKHAN